MPLKHKILVLTVLPLLLAAIAIAAIVAHRAQVLAGEQAAAIEQSFLAVKRAELKHYVELALTSIEHLYSGAGDSAAAQRQARAILGEMNYGDDGYFFVYDLAGNNLVHPRQPELVGRNLWNLQDPSGRRVIQGLLHAAQHGDGFERYQWEKPSTRQMTEKLGYVVTLDRWGWMLGTGLYLDDVERATQQIRAEVRANIEATMWALALVAVVATLVVFAGGLALNVSEHRLADAKLKALAQDIVRLQEVERARVSRELHDGISQLLVSVKFHFEAAQDKLMRDAGDAQADLAKGIGGLTEAISEVRRISHDLRPSLLDDLGLAAALSQLTQEFAQRTGMRVQAAVDGLPAPPQGDRALTLFRIAQEALTNIERHAAASEVHIALEPAGDAVRLRIRDNGRGFDVALIDAPGLRGIGLRNMRERIEHLGGTLMLASQPGQTEIAATLPMPGGVRT